MSKARDKRSSRRVAVIASIALFLFFGPICSAQIAVPHRTETVTFHEGPFKIVGELRTPEGNGPHPHYAPIYLEIMETWLREQGTGPAKRDPALAKGGPDISGCWEGAPDGKFAERNRQWRLISRKPGGRMAISLIYDLTPRCQVWEYDLDVTVEDGAVSWEAHRGHLSEDGTAMTVVKDWKGERSTWTFIRRKDKDDWMHRLASSAGKGYIYEVPESRDDGWACADIAAAGIDRAAIARFMERIAQGRHDDIHGLLIVKDGKLVLEEYFASNGKRYGPFIKQVFRERPHHLASVTKGVLSALCGMAVDRGLIRGADEPIFRHLPAYADTLTEEKRAITVGHLLTMTPGWAWEQFRYPWSDPRNNAAAMYDQEDVIRYVAERHLASGPGATFNYSNGAPTVLGAVLREACGMDVDRFAEQNLFRPLGISDTSWSRYFDGSLEADGGLALRARDLAKIGQLFLNQGEWRGRRIISEEWIRESTRQKIHLGGIWGWGYGYYWMQVDLRTKDGPIHAYFVPGDGGQLLAVFPGLDMVVVFTGGNYGRDDKSVCFSMINTYVLPALLCPVPQNENVSVRGREGRSCFISGGSSRRR
jgi:CubicO group peptidase (beta-lactamase class C family)